MEATEDEVIALAKKWNASRLIYKGRAIKYNEYN